MKGISRGLKPQVTERRCCIANPEPLTDAVGQRRANVLAVCKVDGWENSPYWIKQGQRYQTEGGIEQLHHRG